MKENRLIFQRRNPFGNRRTAVGQAANAAAGQRTTASARSSSSQRTQSSSGSGVQRVGNTDTRRNVNTGPSRNTDTKDGLRINSRNATERKRQQDARASGARQSIGIRPGQFGEINEQAGERVTFRQDPTTGILTATVVGSDGKEIRSAGQFDTPQSVSIRQRSNAGDPLQSPESGVRGPGTGTGQVNRGAEGINVDTGVENLGFIDQSALRRLMTDGAMTMQEALDRINNLRPNIQDTFATTGLGVEFDEQGRVIPGSGKLVAGSTRDTAEDVQSREQGLQSELDQIDADFLNLVQTGMAGPQAGTIRQQRRQNAIAKFNADIEAGAAAAAAARAEQQVNQAPSTTVQPNPVPTIDTLLNSLSPEEAANAQGLYGPVFDAIQTKLQLAGQQLNDTSAQDEIANITNQYQSTQQAILETMGQSFSNFLDKQYDNQVASAERVATQQERTLNMQRRRQESEFNRAIRDQISQNERNRKDWLTGLGLESGWFSSTRSARVIEAIDKGNRIVADLRTDKAFSNEFYSNKMLEVEENYHQNIVNANEARTAAEFQLKEKMLQRAAKIDDTVYNSKVDQINQKQKLKNEYIKTLGELADEYAGAVVEQNKFIITRTDNLRKEEADQKKQLMADTFTYLTKFGTQNKAELRRREELLGLPVGSLSDQKTLAEIKKYGTTSGAAETDLGAMAEFIDSQYDLNFKILVAGGKTEQEAAIIAQDNAVQAWAEYIGTSSKHGPQRIAGQTYVNTKYGLQTGHTSTMKTRTLIDTDVEGEGGFEFADTNPEDELNGDGETIQ